MLIVLSGVETIHRKMFAKNILSFMNTFTVDGYTVDFKKDPFEVTDPTGKVVYSPACDGHEGTNELLIDLDNDGVIDPAGQEVFNKIIELNSRVMLDGVRDNHFANIFADIPYDYGLVDEPSPPFDGGYIQPHTYEDVLNNYRNRTCEVFVITGSFSKHFIDNIRRDLGEENVKVYNIMRNPSVACLVHNKPEAYFIKNDTYTEDFDTNKLHVSISNTANLRRFPDIKEIRFEDAITNGKFVIEGVEIPVPPGYDNYNGLLTQWEYDYIMAHQLVSAENVEFFNSMFSNIATFNGVDNTKIPDDIFAELGYTPLTREQILAK